MSHKITIGEIVETGKPFTLPVDAVTQTVVEYGGKGAGKTNLAAVIIEEFSRAELHWCVLDPMGVWWGLRHSIDGKGPGIECLILGGVHGDIPIEPTGGAVVADLVVDNPHVNVIIDFSRKPSGESWGVGEKIRFVLEYGKRLYQRQSSLDEKKRRRPPLLQVIDEAARFMAQNIRSNEDKAAECFSTWATNVEEGRNFGLGVLMITQRSARLAKAVAELAELMIAFRTVGPNSVKAVTDWLGEHKVKTELRATIEILRSLPRGRALVVSPGWLQFEGIVQFRARTTFDSSATPEPGKPAKKVSGKAAKPDLAKYAALMAETIERAKAEDPRALRARVAELEKELKAAERSAGTSSAAAAAAQKNGSKAIDVDKLKADLETTLARGLKQRDEEWLRTLRDFQRELERRVQNATATLASFMSVPVKLPEPAVVKVTVEELRKGVRGKAAVVASRGSNTTTASSPARPAPRPVLAPLPASDGNGDAGGELGKGERAALVAIAQHPEGVERDTLSVLLGYKRRTRDTYIQRLSARGLVGFNGRFVVATDAGIALLGPEFETLPTGEDLRKHWLDKLPEGERRTLEILLEQHPKAVAREVLDEKTGYARRTRDTYLQRLAARRLVEILGRGEVKASDKLFDEVRS